MLPEKLQKSDCSLGNSIYGIASVARNIVLCVVIGGGGGFSALGFANIIHFECDSRASDVLYVAVEKLNLWLNRLAVCYVTV